MFELEQLFADGLDIIKQLTATCLLWFLFELSSIDILSTTTLSSQTSSTSGFTGVLGCGHGQQ